MEFRTLGRSGFKVPLLSFGTMTFGEGDGFFRAFGSTDARGATRLVDICLEAGANMFDTADVYSHGQSEEVVGTAIAGRRDRVIISTKASFRMGPGPNGPMAGLSDPGVRGASADSIPTTSTISPSQAHALTSRRKRWAR
jgi:aryl-alcohol dehydrogenase-like predicted oxidoreductase